MLDTINKLNPVVYYCNMMTEAVRRILLFGDHVEMIENIG